MKLKIFLIMFCMVFLVGTVSGAEFDNRLKYLNGENGNPDLKVDLENWFGLGKSFGTAELKSHPSVEYVKQVGLGKQVVMYYDFNFVELYSNGLGTPEFINMKTGELVDREWRYVVWNEEVCNETTLGNGTIEQNCVLGYWSDYNSRDIPNSQIRIGVEVLDIKKGDWNDVVWVVGGKKIERHAEFNAVGDVYYKSFTPSGSFPDTGDAEFTDGNYPAAGTGNAGWFAWDTGGGGGIGNITVDLGSDAKKIYNITAWMMTNTDSSIYLPSNLTAWGSNDNSTFTLLGQLTFNGGDTAAATARMATLSPNDVDYRYIRYRGVQDQRWQFWGEGGINWTSERFVVTLRSPANDSSFTTNTINFSVNVSDKDSVGIQNVSLLINGTINQTNTSGLQGQYDFSAVIPNGFWNWSAISYNNSNNLIEATNGTLNFTVSPSVTNSFTYNAFTYETKNETIYSNITTNGSTLTSPKLIWNGSTYSASSSNTAGNNYNLSSSLQIPTGVGNVSVYFNFTLGGVSRNSTQNQQNVALTFFTLCNATYTNDFLNITFQDESDSSYINASIPTSTFEYSLGDGTVNKTLTYSNTANNYNYTFCATPTTEDFFVYPEVQYEQANDYPQRIWKPVRQSYNSTMVEQILYLLGTADGLYVTFQVINVAEQALSGVDVNATRSISGSEELVGVGTTGADGGVTFWLNPDFLHTFGFSKTGFSSLITSLFPTQSAYTITLGSTASTNISDYTKGVNYTISPSVSTVLTNGTQYDFTYNLTSSYWTVTEFGFQIINSSG